MGGSRVALITGAAAGMGFAVAKRLIEESWNVIVVDLNKEQGEYAVKQLGSSSTFIRANVVQYEDQLAAFKQAEKLHGRIDFVFANAGILGKADFYDRAEEWPPQAPSLAVQDICLTGVTYTSYLAMHFMRRNSTSGGVIVMTASGTSLNIVRLS